MTVRAKLIVAAAIGLVAFLALNGPEHARKALDPTGYWTEQRDSSREMVSFYEKELHSCRLDLAKLSRTRDIEMKQRMLAGMSPQEARDDVLTEVEAAKETCSIMETFLADSKADVERAESELTKSR